MPTPEETRLTDDPRCPRCGYDQRGAIAAWNDVCPMEGICSECGYRFAWSDVMRPDRWLLGGFFEHGRGAVRSWTCAMRTLWWALLPWVFWSKVKLHHEVKMRRVVFWPLVALGTLWGLTALARAGAFVTNWLAIGRPRPFPWIEIVNAVVFPVCVCWSNTVQIVILEWNPVFAALFAAGVTWPVLLLVLPETRRRAKVRGVHVLRAGVYGVAWAAVHVVMLLLSGVIGLLSADWYVSLGMQGPVLDLLEEWAFVYGLLLTGWTGLWWWCALAKGFRIARPTLHWAVLMVPALLVVVIVVLYLA